MNRQALALAVLVAASVAQFANAADGTINFNGELVNQTCTLVVNGVVSPTVATVILPSISTSGLTAAGQTGGRTGFNIQLSQCVGTAKTAAAFFNSGSSVDPVTGSLKNVSGSATNVQLQLVDTQTGSPIKAGFDFQRNLTTRNSIDGAGKANMPYAVEYLATGTTTPGTVISGVTFNVDYQ